MIKAAATGVIDFKEIDILGRKWWQKVNILLDQLEKQHYADILTIQHLQHSCALGEMDRSSFEHHWKEAALKTIGLHRLLFPYVKTDVPESEVVKSGERWKQIWGDNNNPEFQKKLKDWAKAVKKDFLTPPAPRKPRRKKGRDYGAF